jgi:RND family efflux transporter MFP subunit
MTRGTVFLRWTRWGGRAAVLLGFTAGVVLLVLWLAGKFTPKVRANAAAAASQAPDAQGHVEPVRLDRWPLSESAVGTIRAVHETSIGSKLLARVLEVNIKAGQKVQAGDVLLRLDDADLRAKLQQAKASVTSIEAIRSQAVADAQRDAKLVGSGAVSQQELERARTAVRSAEADLLRLQENVKEVQAALDWATIRSPIDGTVIDKKVDVGDMVTPGQMLVTLFDPKRMQLVASVRESLTRQLKVGQDIGVRVEGLDKECSGTVSEIVPEAQSASRSFQVKVTGPCPTGVYTGMFGRVVIPLRDEQVLVIPGRAVRNVGQLQLVDVVQDGRVSRRSIRIGRTRASDMEVLSGLCEGEKVVVPTRPSDAVRG